MSLYDKLAALIDDSPVGAPKSDEFIQMLEILYPPGEVEMAVLLSFARSKKLEDIAKEAGMSEVEASKILEEMAAKGTIFSKKSGDTRSYKLWPIYAGIFEYTTLSNKFDPETHKRLNELWRYYYMKDMVHELGNTQPPWKRVLPTETAIPSNEEILPYEVAAELLRTKARSIALGGCACREIEENCDRLRETCLAFDEAADFMIEYGLGRKVSVEEALDVLRASEEAGLVHMSSNNKNNLLFMCNCCPCCCQIFRQYTEFNYPKGINKSSYLAKIEAEACNGCAICAEKRCPAKAINMIDGIAVMVQEQCIGCGLCVTTCPTKAIALTKRADTPEVPETLGELGKAAWNNKKVQRTKEL